MEILKDFFLPRKCPVCGKIDEVLCDFCQREMALSEQICPLCGKQSLLGWTHQKCKTRLGLDGLITIYGYEDVAVRLVMDSIKYDFNQKLVAVLFHKLKLEFGVNFDFIIPVPLHYYRHNWRGFNQSSLIGRELLSDSGAELIVDALVRVKNTNQQAKKDSRKERFRQMKGVFEINKRKNYDLKNKKILLVDDVFTTGATMGECCRKLKQAGGEVVWGFCLAH